MLRHFGLGRTRLPTSMPRARASTNASATTSPSAPKRTGSATATALLLAAAFPWAALSSVGACSTGGGSTAASPASPAKASRSFVSALRSNSVRVFSSFVALPFMRTRNTRTKAAPTAGRSSASPILASLPAELEARSPVQ
eukprot:1000838-Alexandrium_andersonii.AAC.1